MQAEAMKKAAMRQPRRAKAPVRSPRQRWVGPMKPTMLSLSKIPFFCASKALDARHLCAKVWILRKQQPPQRQSPSAQIESSFFARAEIAKQTLQGGSLAHYLFVKEESSWTSTN